MLPGIGVGIVVVVFVVWCLVQTATQNRKQERYWQQVQKNNDRRVQESRKRF